MLTRQLPEVLRLRREGRLGAVENIDVFCERGVFSVDQARRVLEAGADAGLRINFHGEELACLGSAEVKRLLLLKSKGAKFTKTAKTIHF